MIAKIFRIFYFFLKIHWKKRSGIPKNIADKIDSNIAYRISRF